MDANRAEYLRRLVAYLEALPGGATVRICHDDSRDEARFPWPARSELPFPAVAPEVRPDPPPAGLDMRVLSLLQQEIVRVVFEAGIGAALLAKNIARLLQRNSTGSFRGACHALAELGFLEQPAGRGYRLSPAGLDAWQRWRAAA